jgi:hypothetical protein
MWLECKKGRMDLKSKPCPSGSRGISTCYNALSAAWVKRAFPVKCFTYLNREKARGA